MTTKHSHRANAWASSFSSPLDERERSTSTSEDFLNG
jgi:hypothetical protein